MSSKLPVKQALKQSLIESINTIYNREKSKQEVAIFKNKNLLTLKELNYQHLSFILEKHKLDQVSPRLTLVSPDDIDANSDDEEDIFLS